MKRRHALALVFTAPSVVFLAIAWLTVGHFRIDVPPRLDAAARAAAMAPLRAAVDGAAVTRPSAAALTELALPEGGPAIVTLWLDGSAAVRVEGRGTSAAEALAAAASALATSRALAPLDADHRRRARLVVDLVVGRGPLLASPGVLALLGLHPGLEGLGVSLADGRELLVPPDELIRTGLLTAQKPLPSVPDLTVGFALRPAELALARAARLSSSAYDQLGKRYFRFRTDSFVERPEDARSEAPLPLTRGVTPAPPPTRAALRAAALDGAHYLVRHLSERGRYVYEVNLATGRASDPNKRGPYSLPRHAGTTYFLAELFRLTGEEFLREPIERAFGHLADLIGEGGCSGQLPDGEAFACVIDRGDRTAALGSSALAVVALCEYARATGSHRYDGMTRALAAWILSMQRDDGGFAHLYDVASGVRDEHSELLYFSGEAALAMARMYEVYKDPRYLEASRRALDYLTSWYDFFAGGFFYGEEHWTCIAAEAAWPALDDRRYLDFCLGYADFLRRQQVVVGDLPDQDDLAGTYGVTPFVMPNNTPAGSRTEAMISTYVLAEHHGEAPDWLRKQILRSVAYTLGQQVRGDDDFAVRPTADGLGGMPGSPVDRTVRIDYVQHVCSSMIRASQLTD